MNRQAPSDLQLPLQQWGTGNVYLSGLPWLARPPRPGPYLNFAEVAATVEAFPTKNWLLNCDPVSYYYLKLKKVNIFETPIAVIGLLITWGSLLVLLTACQPDSPH